MPQTVALSPPHVTPVTVIAVHGNGGGAFRFSLVAERVPQDIRFVAPDLPGFGSAGRTQPLPSMRAYAEWLADIVEATPTPRVLLGHGVGGAIVLEFLQRHRHLVHAVILHSPVGAQLDTRFLPTLLRARAMRWLAQQALASPTLRPIWRRRFFRAAVPDRVVTAFFENYGRCAAFSRMFDLITPRWFDSLAPVTIPAAVLWGGSERVVAPSLAEAYATVLPDAQVVVEPAWDHFPMLDAPVSYAGRITSLAHELV
ncbi:MAG: alpha/beta fold hydrolase [Gemmatimonadaceae bacterium]|nr:alpha/beta fold hydrolase [Gemmatimonadaceae bacterium]